MRTARRHLVGAMTWTGSCLPRLPTTEAVVGTITENLERAMGFEPTTPTLARLFLMFVPDC